MKKSLFLPTFLLSVFLPAFSFAATDNLLDNPYPINDPRRNFFNNLSDVQKVLVEFQGQIADIEDVANKADAKWVAAMQNSSNEALTQAAVAAAKAQIIAISKLNEIAAKEELGRIKTSIMKGFIGRVQAYLFNAQSNKIWADKKIRPKQKLKKPMIRLLISSLKTSWDLINQVIW